MCCLVGGDGSEREGGEEDLLIRGWVLGAGAPPARKQNPGERWGVPELRLGHVTPEVPLGHPGGDVPQPRCCCLPGPTSSHPPCPLPQPTTVPSPVFHSAPEPPACWKAPSRALRFPGLLPASYGWGHRGPSPTSCLPSDGGTGLFHSGFPWQLQNVISLSVTPPWSVTPPSITEPAPNRGRPRASVCRGVAAAP